MPKFKLLNDKDVFFPKDGMSLFGNPEGIWSPNGSVAMSRAD